MIFKLQTGRNIPIGQTFRFMSPFSLSDNNISRLNVNYNNVYNEWKDTRAKNYQMGFTGDSWDKENELLKKLSSITLDKYPLLLKLSPNLDDIPEVSEEFKNNPRDAYIKYGIRENPEADNIKAYFSSYASSPGYQRIRENQKNWWIQRHPYQKLYIDPEKVLTITDSIRNGLSNIKTKVFDLELPTDVGVNYFGNTALLGTIDTGVYPRDFVMAHELAHTANWRGLDSAKQSAQGEALDQNTNVEKNGHNEQRSEKHSDKEGLMWLLYKENIYDSRGTKDCTPEDIAKLRKLYPYLRPLEQMTDDEAAWMINHVADKGTNYDMTNFAKHGGVIKGKQGLVYTPFIYDLPKSNDDLYGWSNNQWSFPIESVRVTNPYTKSETTEEQTTSQPSAPEHIEAPVQQEVTTPTVTPTVTPGNIKIRSNHPDTGKMKNFLDFIQSKGVSLIVTSGTRPNSTTKSGHKSRHSIGEAIDVAPIDGNFDKLLEALKNPDIVKYMKDNRIRILNETSKYVMGLTGATGPHLHISINGERFGKNVWDHVVAYDDDWYTYTGRQRPILRFGGILQRGGLIYTPFTPNKQDLLWDNLVTTDETSFPVEPVKVFTPVSIESTPTKETIPESDEKPKATIVEEPEVGKVYTSKEREQFKSDMYNAYLTELSSRGLSAELADAFAKRLTTQDILESGWGQSSLSKYFNFGGIKDFRSNSNPVVLTTHEYENGERKTKKQPFRRFSNLSEYVKYKIDLVSKNWNVFDDIPEMYFENLVKGKLKYATSPTYADKLDKLFKSIWKTT